MSLQMYWGGLAVFSWCVWRKMGTSWDFCGRQCCRWGILPALYKQPAVRGWGFITMSNTFFVSGSAIGWTTVVYSMRKCEKARLKDLELVERRSWAFQVYFSGCKNGLNQAAVLQRCVTVLNIHVLESLCIKICFWVIRSRCDMFC